jgi:hypothetical protein
MYFLIVAIVKNSFLHQEWFRYLLKLSTFYTVPDDVDNCALNQKMVPMVKASNCQVILLEE